MRVVRNIPTTRSVACPFCGAPRGRPCRGLQGQVIKDHHRHRTATGTYMPRPALDARRKP